MASVQKGKRTVTYNKPEGSQPKCSRNELTREFNDDWTQSYAFIFRHGKPQCLICQETIAANKKSNLKRHHETKHSQFSATFPMGSKARQERINKLQESLMASEGMIVSFTSTDKRATEASLRVSKILAKAMVPYSHAEMVKECLIEVTQTLFPDKAEIIDKVKAVPLSRKTATNRIENISDHLRDTLQTQLNRSECFSIAIDESTDVMDVAQLAVFVR